VLRGPTNHNVELWDSVFNDESSDSSLLPCSPLIVLRLRRGGWLQNPAGIRDTIGSVVTWSLLAPFSRVAEQAMTDCHLPALLDYLTKIGGALNFLSGECINEDSTKFMKLLDGRPEKAIRL
jgi:hypothetical protein